jgi:CO dehydrogenase maturation factor
MEHISRQTTRDVDRLFIISDPTQRGLAAASYIVRLVESLGTRIDRSGLVLNRVKGGLQPAVREAADALGVPLFGTLPEDPVISSFDAEGRPLIELDESSAVYPAVEALLDACL